MHSISFYTVSITQDYELHTSTHVLIYIERKEKKSLSGKSVFNNQL